MTYADKVRLKAIKILDNISRDAFVSFPTDAFEVINMSTALKAQLLASMRKGVEELDGKILDAEAYANTKPVSLAEAWDKVEALQDERNALIKRIEEAEEADDRIRDLLNAINDAYDGEYLTAGSLQAQLDNHGLVVSRALTIIETKTTEVSTTTLKSTQSLEEQRANWKKVRETIKGWRK